MLCSFHLYTQNMLFVELIHRYTLSLSQVAPPLGILTTHPKVSATAEAVRTLPPKQPLVRDGVITPPLMTPPSGDEGLDQGNTTLTNRFTDYCRYSAGEWFIFYIVCI